MKFYLIFVILNITLSTKKPHQNNEVWAGKWKRERDSYAYVWVIKCMSKINVFHTIINTDMISSFDTEAVRLELWVLFLILQAISYGKHLLQHYSSSIKLGSLHCYALKIFNDFQRAFNLVWYIIAKDVQNPIMLHSCLTNYLKSAANSRASYNQFTCFDIM